MGSNSSAGSGSLAPPRSTPAGRSSAAQTYPVSTAPFHEAGKSRPGLRSRQKRSDPSWKPGQNIKRGGAPTNGTNVDTSQWNIGRLASEVERLSQGNCSLYDTYPGPNLKTRIVDLPIIYPFERCRLMAKLAPPNATQLRFVQTDAVLDYVNSYYDPIDDVASLRPFRNSSDLIGQLALLFRGNERLCIGVYPNSAYAAVEQWLTRLAKPGLYRDVLYVHAAPAPSPRQVTEPEYSVGNASPGSCGALTVGLSLALWGGLTAVIIKVTRPFWGPSLQQALDLTRCVIPCCNLREIEEEEDDVVREFLGQYGCQIPECDPDSLDPEAVSDALTDLPAVSSPTSVQAVQVEDTVEDAVETADTRTATTAPVNESRQEESIVTMIDLDD